jgi:hypothetical protein
MGLLISKIKFKKKFRIEFKNYLNYNNYNNYNKMDYCIKCDILNFNTYFIYHCKLCDSCHYKNKLYCNTCHKCYDPFIDKDLLIHRKVCLHKKNINN